MCTAKTLIRLGGCPGWSESCWAHTHFVGFVMSWLIYFTYFHNLWGIIDCIYCHYCIPCIFHFMRPMRLHTKSEGRCEMHPKSVNMNIMEPESQWVIYHLVMKTSGVSRLSLLNLIQRQREIRRLFELRHDKTNKVTVRPAKTQISLGICPFWS